MKGGTKILLVALLSLVMLNAHARNGVDPEQLEFQRWENGRPESMTIISGTVDGAALYLFGGPPMGRGVLWFDKANNKPRQLEILCRLNAKSSLKCGETVSDAYHRVNETYIGPPEGLRLQGLAKTKRFAQLSMSDLAAVPGNVKKVMFADVWAFGWLRQVVTVVFDENISDDDMRTLMLEDGIYRVYGWRD